MKALDNYKKELKKIHEYFGLEEGWQVFPLDDNREFFWSLGECQRKIMYSLSEPVLKARQSKDTLYFYEDYVADNVHYPKTVFRAKDFTMILLDTQCDDNVFLSIFDNKKEIS